VAPHSDPRSPDRSEPDVASCLAPTATLDFDNPAVRVWADTVVEGAVGPRDAAVRLFHAVRDGPIYDPYCCVPTVPALRASATLTLGRGGCAAKAILLAACCRAVGIPARLGFADVRNHLATPHLQDLLDSDVHPWHGFALISVEGKWLRAMPAFNSRLCRRFGMDPVDWDGTRDSLLHPPDWKGRRWLEYLGDRGEYDDVPVEAIAATFHEMHPRLVMEGERRLREGADALEFEREAIKRTLT
jgi:transglutaminase-like putative cysteine protease